MCKVRESLFLKNVIIVALMIIKKKGKVAIYDGLRCSPGSDPQETKNVMIDSFNTAMIIKKIWKLMKI